MSGAAELGQLGSVTTVDASGNVAFSQNVSTTATMYMGSSFLRNRLINGAMEIWQRGTSFGSVGGYAPDRFYCNRNGGVAGVTYSKASAAFGTKKDWLAIQRDNGNTSTASAAIYQAIEGINSRDLAGGNVTLSLLMGTGGTLSSTTNNMTLQIYYQTTTTDTGPTGSWTIVSGTQFSVASNVGPTRYSATFAVPGTATQIMTVISFSFSGTASTDDRYYITEVQLEAGSVATPFERRLYGQELALCQRYFYTSYPSGSATGAVVASPVFAAAQAACNYLGTSSAFPVPMRATPTLSVYSTVDGASGFAGVDGVNKAVTGAAYQRGYYVYLNNVAVTAAQFMTVHITAAIEL